MAEFTAPPFATETEKVKIEEEVKVGEPVEMDTPEAAVPETEKRKRSTVLIDDEKIKTIIANVKTKSYVEMAEMTGLTKHQVNRVLQTLKMGMRQKALAADENAYAIKTTKKGVEKPDYSKPVSELAKKVEAQIAAKLCRPEGIKIGSSGGGGKTKKALNSALEDLLADL